MNVDVYLKQGDLLPAIAITCEDTNGLVVDLSAATDVRFFMRPAREEDNIVNDAQAVFTDKPGGQIQYNPQNGDTLAPGTYLGRFSVIFPTDAPMSFPAHGDLVIVIERASSTPLA